MCILDPLPGYRQMLMNLDAGLRSLVPTVDAARGGEILVPPDGYKLLDGFNYAVPFQGHPRPYSVHPPLSPQEVNADWFALHVSECMDLLNDQIHDAGMRLQRVGELKESSVLRLLAEAEPISSTSTTSTTSSTGTTTSNPRGK